jgi:hypothetical protein
MPEKKMIDFKFEDGKFVLSVDPNKDGEPVLFLALDVKEVPDEIVSALTKKDEETTPE